MLKTASGDNAMERTQTFELFSQFKCWKTLVGDREHSCCPSTGHTRKCGDSSQNSQWRPTKYHFGDDWPVRPWSLTEDLNMRQISAKFVPWFLTDKQKQWHVFVCLELLDEWPKLSLEYHNRRWSLSLLSWPRNQTLVFSVEKPVLPMPEESRATQVEHQEHVGDLFYCDGSVPSGICSSRPNVWS
jgi:hypothetical protein